MRIARPGEGILSDLGAETAGGLGRAPSVRLPRRWLGVLRARARLRARHRGPRHREPDRHHPVGGEMLDDMGLGAEAQRLEAAVARVCRDGKRLTPAQGGAATTREMAQAVLDAYRNA